MTDVLFTVLGYVFGAGVFAAMVTYVLERRSKDAKAKVDIRTVDAQVDAFDLANFNTRLSLIERAHDQERESWRDTMSGLRSGLEDAKRRIGELERQVHNTNSRYREAVAYIRVLRAWISRQVPSHDAPDVPEALTADFDDRS